MKIHTDLIHYNNLHMATGAAGMRGVYIEGATRHGSRSRARAFNVTLRGNSTRRPNWGTGARDTDEGYAATWDEWGMFINWLYLIDPKALIGQYGDREVFREATAFRFDTLTADRACPGHKWEPTGEPYVSACSRCSAVNNYAVLVHRMIAARAA